jgi:hypothetical protein
MSFYLNSLARGTRMEASLTLQSQPHAAANAKGLGAAVLSKPRSSVSVRSLSGDKNSHPIDPSADQRILAAKGSMLVGRIQRLRPAGSVKTPTSLKPFADIFASKAGLQSPALSLNSTIKSHSVRAMVRLPMFSSVNNALAMVATDLPGLNGKRPDLVPALTLKILLYDGGLAK